MTNEQARNLIPGCALGDLVVTGIEPELDNGDVMVLGTCSVCGANRRVRCRRITGFPLVVLHGRACIPPVKERFSIGGEIGDMVIIDYVLNNDGQHTDLLCKCKVCGDVKQIYISNINKDPGITLHTSCIYGKLPRLRQIHAHMLDRIYNPENSHYALYGGRGLTTDYDDYADFYRDYAQAYIAHCEQFGEDNTTLDRINNDLGYLRGNMRFLTIREQCMNRRFMKDNFYFCFEPIEQGGRVYATDNMSAFCRNHDITQGNVPKVLRGERHTVNGWQIKRVTDLPEYVLFRPADLIYEYYGISADYKAIELPPLPSDENNGEQ